MKIINGNIIIIIFKVRFKYETYLTDASEINRVKNPNVKDKFLLNLKLVSFFDLIIKIPQIKAIKNI